MKSRWLFIGLALVAVLALATSLVAAKTPTKIPEPAPVAAYANVEGDVAPAVVYPANAAPVAPAAGGKDGGAMADPPVVGQGGTCISGYVIDTYHQPQGAGWTIRVTLEGGTAQTKTIDAKGAFKFEKLGAGTYLVELDVPAGWQPFTPAAFKVTLSGAGTGCAEVRMKLEAQPCLEIVKLDADGKMGFAQPVGIPGWGITAASKLATVNGVTDGQGRLRFTNLATGIWTVTEESRVGWIPAPGSAIQQRITLIAPRVPGGCQTVQFVNKQVHTGCIQVIKVDTAGKPLAGWKISLSRPDGTQASISKVTNSAGIATFDGLALGEWRVKEEVQPNWRTVGAAETVINLNTPGRCVNITFKNEALGCVAGYKINHLDQGLAGWTIKARNAAGEEYTTVTDKNGFFQFHQLSIGTWTLSEEPQQGWEAVTPAEFDVVVTKPFVCEHVRFKNRTTFACVDIYKKDAWDNVGLPGWQIHIKPAYGGTLQTGITDGTGHVRFNGLTPGTYVISETLQPGWTPVTPQRQVVTLAATGSCSVLTLKNRQAGTPVLPPTGAGCRYTHIVHYGDTLFSLARRYGTTVDAIKRANGMWNDTIYIGSKLCIP
jgi:LysM repeat protein